MKDNALRIILFVYILSGTLAAMDSLIAAPLGIPFTDMHGNPAGPQISTVWAKMSAHDMEGRMLEAAGQMDAGTILERAAASLSLGVDMTVELFKLMAGLYAFDILTIFGVPHEITAIIVSAYVILVARALIGYMPAIAAAVQALVSVGRAVGSVAGPAAGTTARLLHLR